MQAMFRGTLCRFAGRALALLVAVHSAVAAADVYSVYEEQAIHDAETKLGADADPAPAGKRVEAIDFVRIDPIDAHDPLPRWVDAVHVTTRVFLLRRELLVSEGQRWDQALVDESARNLRGLSDLSLVLCIPM